MTPLAKILRALALAMLAALLSSGSCVVAYSSGCGACDCGTSCDCNGGCDPDCDCSCGLCVGASFGPGAGGMTSTEVLAVELPAPGSDRPARLVRGRLVRDPRTGLLRGTAELRTARAAAGER